MKGSEGREKRKKWEARKWCWKVRKNDNMTGRDEIVLKDEKRCRI